MFTYATHGDAWDCVRSFYAPRKRCWTATKRGTATQITGSTKDDLIARISADYAARERRMARILASAVVTHSV